MALLGHRKEHDVGLPASVGVGGAADLAGTESPSNRADLLGHGARPSRPPEIR